jgi:hypothetical protein
LYPGQPSTVVQSFSLIKTSVAGAPGIQKWLQTKHFPDSCSDPLFLSQEVTCPDLPGFHQPTVTGVSRFGFMGEYISPPS